MRIMISTVSIIQAELFLKKTKQNLNSRKKKETKCCRICHEWMPRRSAPRATSLHRYSEGKKIASHWVAPTDKLSPLKASQFSSWTYNNTTTIAMKLQAHHNFKDSIFEVQNGRVSVVLVNATVQSHAGVGMLHQLLHDLISVFLLVHKHQRAALFVVFTQQLQQLEELLVFFNHNLDKYTLIIIHT